MYRLWQYEPPDFIQFSKLASRSFLRQQILESYSPYNNEGLNYIPGMVRGNYHSITAKETKFGQHNKTFLQVQFHIVL